MTPTEQKTETSALEKALPLVFSGFEVSWAGAGRERGHFCFGSEDGNLRFTTAEGHLLGGMKPATVSPESVNGVAFLRQTIGVSTRSEVTFWDVPPEGSLETKRVVVPGGAHGILATAAGYFVAPLGQNGFMTVKAEHGEEQAITIRRAAKRDLYFYRIVSLPLFEGREVLACAARQAGVVRIDSGEASGGRIVGRGFAGLDVVDVCSLASSAAPYAMAAIGRDCTLAFFEDFRSNALPVAIRFGGIRGAAYRLFTFDGHVLVLTSYALYLLVDLAQGFLSGLPIDRQRSRLREVTMEAVDANVVDGHWLLAVLPDRVLRFDLRLMADIQGENAAFDDIREVGASAIRTKWEAIEDELDTKPLFSAA